MSEAKDDYYGWIKLYSLCGSSVSHNAVNYVKELEQYIETLAKAIVETQTVDDSDDGQYCPFCFEKHSYNDDKYPHKSDCVVTLARELLK